MAFDSNFLPGKVVLWKNQRHLVVDCQDLEHVIVQRPGKRKLWRAPITAISVEPKSIQNLFNPPDLTAITDKAWRAALDRYERLRPLIEMDPAQRTFAQVSAVADAEGRHPATIYRWIGDYQRTHRVSCFLKKPRADQGTTRISEELERIIEEAIKTKYLGAEKPSIVDVVEEVALQCRQKQFKPPHDNTVRRRVSLVSERTKLEKRQGREAAENKFDPMLGHFPGADYPLAVVQMDHTPMDIIVVDEEDRKPINRPYLTIIIDVFSRMVLGFAIYLEKPSAFTSGLAISHAILTKDEWLDELSVKVDWPCWGKFRKLHCDNAKEFRGTVIGRACEEHKITVEHRPKGRPRYGGHVERGFRTFMRRLHTVKGTTFSDIKERAKYDSSGRAIMTRRELERWFTIYIAKYYPNKFHRGIKDTPLHRYKAGILGTDGHMGIGLPERIQDSTRFMLDFMPFEERSVQDYGILLNHVYYYDDALRHWICARDPADPAKSRKFIIRYNPRKMHEVYFYDPVSADYITIAYRDRSHPPASWWEIQAAADRLNREGRSHVNEDLIFEAIEEMREIEEESERITKGARRKREKRKHQPTMPAKLGAASTQPTAGQQPLTPDTEDPADLDRVPASPYEGIVEPE
jgi:putative transposase